jgi:cell division protein ZapB
VNSKRLSGLGSHRLRTGPEADILLESNRTSVSWTPMADLNAIVERVEKLLLRQDELKRTNDLLQRQVDALTLERDALKTRLGAARGRLDALMERLSNEPDLEAGPPST